MPAVSLPGGLDAGDGLQAARSDYLGAAEGVLHANAGWLCGVVLPTQHHDEDAADTPAGTGRSAFLARAGRLKERPEDHWPQPVCRAPEEFADHRRRLDGRG